MNKRQIQNTAVIIAALGAAFVSIYKNTDWLSKRENRTTRKVL